MVLTRARWYFVNQTVGYLANCVVLRVAQVMQNHRENRWSSFCWDTRYYYCTTRPTPRATEARRALSLDCYLAALLILFLEGRILSPIGNPKLECVQIRTKNRISEFSKNLLSADTSQNEVKSTQIE